MLNYFIFIILIICFIFPVYLDFVVLLASALPLRGRAFRCARIANLSRDIERARCVSRFQIPNP
ncbi:hypothetical protein D8T34_17200 [Vibrio vulnificus]|nr:hypothetical protein [Vibrio vulnificus]RZP82076.1 hypothetical protein D8T60_00605 [Vibrio vulnificus]RZR20367.1 hypothetical protein D8T64_13830 [Vibrio vulnificus]RZR55082.1 hypothetical protein D8T34_17200 [Vibrio vulnificus]HAS8326732.1 hypothetical protein [Vibrio vulnificus]